MRCAVASASGRVDGRRADGEELAIDRRLRIALHGSRSGNCSTTPSVKGASASCSKARRARLLDIDHGTYPFVTSSNTVAGQAASGSGVGPGAAGYRARHHQGLHDARRRRSVPDRADRRIGEFLGTRGHEFGTVTGRKRRCGWFDAVLVRQTVALSGITGIALTKLDVLDGFDELKICVGYRSGRSSEIDYLPASQARAGPAEPIYETLEGWKDTTAGARSWADLPAQAIKYVRHVEELIGAPVALVDQPRARRHDPGAGSVPGLRSNCRHSREGGNPYSKVQSLWIPAFAGMTKI
jgi:hypothetical protein